MARLGILLLALGALVAAGCKREESISPTADQARAQEVAETWSPQQKEAARVYFEEVYGGKTSEDK